MKALQITRPGSTSLVDLPDPTPGPDDLLLKIIHVGFCGTDLNTFAGRNPLVTFPRIPGHEISAVIFQKGKNVPGHLRTGDRVTVNPYTHCGTCSACLRQQPNACRTNQTLGVQRDGAMGEWFVIPWQKAILAPGLDARELSLIEPLTIGFHAVDRADVTDRDTVLVLGSGLIGLGAVIRASLRGAVVVASDLDDGKLAVARSAGAARTVNPRSENLSEVLGELTQGQGPDVVIEAAGSPQTYRTAAEIVAFAGRIACIGYAGEDVPLTTKLFVQKEVTLRGSRNALNPDFESVIRHLGKHTLPVEKIISRQVDLPRAGEALGEWAKKPEGITRILVDL